MGFFRDPEHRIPIPGILDWNFLIWARSKNPENSGDRDRDRDLKIRKKSRVKIPENPGIPGIGIGI